MRKPILLLILFMTVSFAAHAQSRGVKIGYIDMEYILQNVPDYTEAKNQLEQKAQKWKQEIETKKNELLGLKESLKTERVLLTKELLDEREEEIAFQEKELLDYQEKRFGPKGDLTIQKAVLTQPVQDQVFNAAQDIAEAKKYDFIFDKTSDLTILFAAKRYDISDQVIRVITRSSKRNQLSKKQLKEEQAKEAKEDMDDESPALAERQKKLNDRKAAREQLIADRKLATEEKKKATKAAIEARRNGTPTPAGAEGTPKDSKTIISKENPAKKEADSIASAKKQQAAEERAKIVADRKKAADDKRQQLLSDKEAKKNASKKPATTEPNPAKKENTPVTPENKKEANTKAAAPSKPIDSTAVDKKQKAAEERAKNLADRKKALEDKKKKVIEDREAAKKAKEDKAKENKKE